MSALEQIDFQSILQQDITHFMGFWAEQGMPPEQCQDNAGQLFNMGTIAAQQLIQSPQIQIENAPAPIDLTPELAEQIVKVFVAGLQNTYLQGFKYGVPGQECTEIIQNTALFVFEQSKNMAVAMISQPPGQMSVEQVNQWIAQSAGEAFNHFLSELEKERGPIIGKANEVPDAILGGSNEALTAQTPAVEAPQQEQAPAYVEPEPVQESAPVEAPQQPQQADVHEANPKSLYHQVALGLILSSTPKQRQAVMASFCDPNDLKIAQHYQDMSNVPSTLDMTELIQTIKQVKHTLKEQMAKAPKRPSDYRRRVGRLMSVLPPVQVEKVFQNERQDLKNYLQQFNQVKTADLDSNTQTNQLTLPIGVTESLIRYLKFRFPNEADALKSQGNKEGKC